MQKCQIKFLYGGKQFFSFHVLFEFVHYLCIFRHKCRPAPGRDEIEGSREDPPQIHEDHVDNPIIESQRLEEIEDDVFSVSIVQDTGDNVELVPDEDPAVLGT